MQVYEGKKLLLIWDGATYHGEGKMKEFLEEANHGLLASQVVKETPQG